MQLTMLLSMACSAFLVLYLCAYLSRVAQPSGIVPSTLTSNQKDMPSALPKDHPDRGIFSTQLSSTQMILFSVKVLRNSPIGNPNFQTFPVVLLHTNETKLVLFNPIFLLIYFHETS